MISIGGLAAAANLKEVLKWAMVGGNIHVEVYTVDGTYISGQVLQLRDDLAIVGAMPLEDGPHWYGHVVLLAHITRIEVRVQAPTLI